MFYSQVFIIFSSNISQKHNTNFYVYFWEKYSSDILTIMVSDKDLFIKDEWLPFTYFFFRGAWLSRILLQEAAKHLKISSHPTPEFCKIAFCSDSWKCHYKKTWSHDNILF